jgi:hypothetical protein
MGAYHEEIRAQLRESCAVKQGFPEQLLSRIELSAINVQTPYDA